MKKNGLFVVYLQKETGDMTNDKNRFNHHLQHSIPCLLAQDCASSGLFGAMGHLVLKTAVLVRKNAIFGSGKCVCFEMGGLWFFHSDISFASSFPQKITE
ncbi:MAG: hypothetical protein IJM65_03920 [Bacteroidales bacterium]|nr:hypothetical protein [Bacteroidales bacterium]